MNDSVDCILRNFVEMNRLWIRIQSGNARDKEQREVERRELQVLVGSNLVCLSQLDGIDATFYQTVHLSHLLDSSESSLLFSTKSSAAMMRLLSVISQSV